MKINTFINLLELLSSIRSHVDATGEQIYSCHDYHNLIWRNKINTQEWTMNMQWYHVPGVGYWRLGAIDDAILEQRITGNLIIFKKDKLSQFIKSGICDGNNILDKYLNYGDRILNLTAFI